jgi:hypothetical protein
MSACSLALVFAPSVIQYKHVSEIIISDCIEWRIGVNCQIRSFPRTGTLNLNIFTVT